MAFVNEAIACRPIFWVAWVIPSVLYLSASADPEPPWSEGGINPAPAVSSPPWASASLILCTCPFRPGILYQGSGARGQGPVKKAESRRQKAASAGCLLPSAFCLLPSAFCLLPSAFCLLPSAFCLLPSAFC